jgi:hypothetical protein
MKRERKSERKSEDPMTRPPKGSTEMSITPSVGQVLVWPAELAQIAQIVGRTARSDRARPVKHLCAKRGGLGRVSGRRDQRDELDLADGTGTCVTRVMPGNGQREPVPRFRCPKCPATAVSHSAWPVSRRATQA